MSWAVDHGDRMSMIASVKRIMVASILGLFLWGAGCHRPIPPTGVTAQHIRVADQASSDRLWENCQEVLRRHRFEIDRVDRHAGTITTQPVTSGSFFEFWRHDVDTSFDLWEATLRTVRRLASVQVAPAEANQLAQVTVVVRRQTFATPERQFNSSASALQVFGDALPGVAGEPYLSSKDDYWIDAGRDAAMEERLLARIVARTQP